MVSGASGAVRPRGTTTPSAFNRYNRNAAPAPGAALRRGPQEWLDIRAIQDTADPATQAANQWWRQNVPIGMRTTKDFLGFLQGGAAPGGPAAPAYPNYGGGGGRGGYGGGGGGGAAAPLMSQAMFDSMLQALGTRAPQLSLSQVDLPDFQGQDIAAFDPAMYDQLTQNLATAVAADQAAITSGANQTTQALGAYNANPYAGAAAAPPPQAGPQGAALQATAGGGVPNARDPNAAAAAGVNATGGAQTAAFNDLLKVLGANYNQSQNSRLSQVQQTAQSAQNQLGAQNLGIGSQIGMARNQGYQQWQQRDAERRNQNALMAQQWQREEQMRNQDIANQQSQGRWQQGNEMIQNRLGPLLQLLQGTQGAGINTDALTQMLAGWGQ